MCSVIVTTGPIMVNGSSLSYTQGSLNYITAEPPDDTLLFLQTGATYTTCIVIIATSSEMAGAIFPEIISPSTAFQDYNLAGINLSAVDLSYYNLTGCVLTGAILPNLASKFTNTLITDSVAIATNIVKNSGVTISSNSKIVRA